mmetsp:Transcript_2644/g.8811  ORF Transcript_2644/g.8811 Transcript_2644/m.8811 type:complete len:256 (-) Transcript_2644:712-1479(-)
MRKADPPASHSGGGTTSAVARLCSAARGRAPDRWLATRSEAAPAHTPRSADGRRRAEAGAGRVLRRRRQRRGGLEEGARREGGGLDGLVAEGGVRVVVVDLAHLVVDVHKAAVHLLQPLDLVLEHDSHVVRHAQRRLGQHHDLNLDEEARPKVVRAHEVEAGGGVVRLGHLAHLVEELRVGGAADEELELLHAGAEPRVDNVHRDGDGADGVGEPEGGGELREHRGGEGAQVGEDVVQVVLRHRLHRHVVGLCKL